MSGPRSGVRDCGLLGGVAFNRPPSKPCFQEPPGHPRQHPQRQGRSPRPSSRGCHLRTRGLPPRHPGERPPGTFSMALPRMRMRWWRAKMPHGPAQHGRRLRTARLEVQPQAWGAPQGLKASSTAGSRLSPGRSQGERPQSPPCHGLNGSELECSPKRTWRQADGLSSLCRT